MRVLVVDDDEVSRELMALLLEQEEYEVETADSGEAALALLQRRRGSPPGAVLADVQMPGVAGEELARQMRALCGSNTVLLAISASEAGEYVLREFDGFLRKPFTMEALATAIRGASVESADELKGAGALDEAVYRRWAAMMSPEKLRQLYSVCLDDAARRIAAMRQAAWDGDDAAYRREAHAIKGGCGMTGAAELQAIAASMEENGLSSTNNVALLDKFVICCERLRRILVARLGKTNSEGTTRKGTP